MKSDKLKGARLLVIDDDPDILASLEMILRGEGCFVENRGNGEEGYREALASDYDLILTDFRLPGMGGLELIRKLMEDEPACPVALMTAHGNTELAIEATKQGAFDYLLKPFEIDELLEVVSRGVKAGRSRTTRNASGRKESVPDRMAPEMMGNSRAMQRVYKEIGRISPTGTTVLITGETGTGKELVAKTIHRHSRRADGPFVAVNCGAIPENLLESELFGHVKGAFTGAESNRSGRFEEAAGGTLFLDEIGDMPLPVQVKLLRVLQEGTFQSLGSSAEKQSDARVIAATHRDLTKMIREGSFREDLFFRLSALQVSLPSLGERTGDMGPLVKQFLIESCHEYGISVPSISPRIIAYLEKQDWPGNIRQLKNVIRYAVLHSRGFPVERGLIDEALSGNRLGSALGSGESMVPDEWIAAALEEAIRDGRGEAHARLTHDLESRLISMALEKSGGHLGRVTEWLGISRVTLRKKMADLGIGSD